jgi:hypothetical protein
MSVCHIIKRLSTVHSRTCDEADDSGSSTVGRGGRGEVARTQLEGWLWRRKEARSRGKNRKRGGRGEGNSWKKKRNRRPVGGGVDARGEVVVALAARGYG